MNWIILIVAGLFETGFAFCLGKMKEATGAEYCWWGAGFLLSLALSMTLLAIFTSWPALSLLARMPDFAMMLSVLLWLSFIYGIYNGAMIPALTEIMPKSVRVAGFSLAYSLATALFGGFTPAMSTALIKVTGDKAAPGYWMSFAAICALLATLYLYQRVSRQALKTQNSLG